MIDRLEELLAGVEDPESGEAAVLLKQVRLATEYTAARQPEELPVEMNNSTAGQQAAENGETAPAAGESMAAPLRKAAANVGALSGLPELYRQMARITGGSSAAGHGSVAVIRETVTQEAGGLSAGELDLAMRRDSRRYDGGMTIY